jgi:MtN3 and saliva related transmembrane protein
MDGARAESENPMNDLIGYLAAGLTTLSFLPQALHTFRTRDVSGISLGMYSMFATGVALWLVYGLLLGSWPLIAANSVTLTLALAILVMKLRYGPGGKK